MAVGQPFLESGCIFSSGPSHSRAVPLAHQNFKPEFRIFNAKQRLCLRAPPASGIIAIMGSSLPLTALLSQLLVAFTIEFDNEAEHRLPHRTTLLGKPGATPLDSPWLVSMVMWFNCMQHLGNGPIPLSELERRARTPTNLHGMQRWGYIRVTNENSAALPFRPQPRRTSSMVSATATGKAARQVWAPLFDKIEDRWIDRFGSTEIKALHTAAKSIVIHLDPQLPDCLPILTYGLSVKPAKKPSVRKPPGPPEAAPVEIDSLALPSLLSKPLLAIALEFETDSAVSLAICANVVRVLSREGVRVRDLPALSGVSKESIAMAFGILRKNRLVIVEKESKQSPWQMARLTESGVAVQNDYPLLLAEIERRWESRLGKQAIRTLHKAAETIAGNPTDPDSLLLKSTKPYPDGWRAFVSRPQTLPQFPMVLHRGGYPDGS